MDADDQRWCGTLRGFGTGVGRRQVNTVRLGATTGGKADQPKPGYPAGIKAEITGTAYHGLLRAGKVGFQQHRGRIGGGTYHKKAVSHRQEVANARTGERQRPGRRRGRIDDRKRLHTTLHQLRSNFSVIEQVVVVLPDGPVRPADLGLFHAGLNGGEPVLVHAVDFPPVVAIGNSIQSIALIPLRIEHGFLHAIIMQRQ